MIEPFLCYVFNTYPEIPFICKKLEAPTRQLFEGSPMDEVSQDLRSCVPDVEDFLMTREGRFLPTVFHHTTVRGIEVDSFAKWPLAFRGELRQLSGVRLMNEPPCGQLGDRGGVTSERTQVGATSVARIAAFCTVQCSSDGSIL